MNFNLDDPLAGILSDGSDDSFFDDDILGKKKPAKKKSTPIAEKKNALFDLGDGDKTKPKLPEEKKESLFDLGFAEAKKVSVPNEKTQKSPAPIKRTLSKESFNIQSTEPKIKPNLEKLKSPGKIKNSARADKFDILGELTTEKKKDTFKPLEKGKSSQSLLDDILGGAPTKTDGSSQITRPTTAAKSKDFDFESILGKDETKNISKSVPSHKQNVKNENLKEDPVKTTKSNENWLGIFEDKTDNIDEHDNDMPAWLVGESTKKKPAEPVKDVVHEQKRNEPRKETEMEMKTEEPNHEQLVRAAPSLSMLRSSNEDVTTEGAALYLQEQESQLIVAMQLKAQEEKLAALQMRQKDTHKVQREAALAHHAQLDIMLRRQAEQRQQMQAVISAHQERITQRIKALLGSTNIEDEDDNIPNKEVFENNQAERKDSPHVKEKKQLLQLVQSLQENHDKEIDLMETSYRRQLAFLEVSVNQYEERMKEESDMLVKYYTEKISWMEEHHLLYKKLSEDNLNSLSERYKVENEMLRQQHLDNVKVLQEHHAALMENIKNAVKQEHVMIKDSAGFSSDLLELVTDVKESKSQCQKLLEKVQALTDNTQRHNERSLQTRETQVEEIIQHLKKERESFESEKNESREMVRLLETRLKQMTTMIEEETSSMKSKKMEFEFERATFSKQTEFAKNVLKKQDEEIKMLKEDIQKEYNEKISKINEERAKAMKDSAAVAKEKASIQSLKQELDKTKAELEAQLEELAEERSKLNLEKQQMHMEEQRILAKSRDLDLLAKSAIEKQQQADKKYSEAEFIQRKYEDRIRRIQEHVVSLNSREKQIAREKVALSRERLSLHNERKEIEGRQHCSLCKSTQNVPPYSLDAAYTLPESFLNVPVSRDYGGGNVNSAMNAIEQEMAHLIGRNFSLRHSTAIGNVTNREQIIHERHNERAADDNTSDTNQIDSGTFKNYLDPKFMMLRLDVQHVLSNLDQYKKEDGEAGHEDE